MVQVVIIEKNGSLKELNVQKYDNDNLCKKAGFKSTKDFKAHSCWKQDHIEVYLYGKTEGRAGQENKYDMPPPIDNTLFFGSCLLLMKKNNKEVDLSVKVWKEMYENLFGGFEDIGDEDSEDEENEEDDEDADLPQTKEGYAKDGFVVGDDEEDEDEEDEDEEEDEEEEDDDIVGVDDDEDDEDDEEDEEDEEVSSPKRVQPKRNAKKPTKNVFVAIQNAIEDEFLNCESELSEEEYL